VGCSVRERHRGSGRRRRRRGARRAPPGSPVLTRGPDAARPAVRPGAASAEGRDRRQRRPTGPRLITPEGDQSRSPQSPSR